MKHIAVVLFLSLSLSACAVDDPSVAVEQQIAETEIDASRLVSLSREMLIDEGLGNCPINEIKIPGEGLRAAGSSGGLFTSPFTFNTVPDDLYKVVKDTINLASPAFNQPTAILIVDDFDGMGLSQPGTYLPDARGNGSHGALVLNHTLALLNTFDPIGDPAKQLGNALPVYDPAPDIPFDFRPLNVPLVEFPNFGITVAAVDTQDFDTDIIAGRIAATLHTLSQRGISRFAINLSFGLVPCSVLEDFEEVKKRYPTFEAYRDAILNANRLDVTRFREELAQILTTPVGQLPLRQLAQLDPEDYFPRTNMVAYLASAGNYKMDHSLYPGYWPEFASVSAADLSTWQAPNVYPSKDYTYSNTGEVLLPGGYYQFTHYDPSVGDWVSERDIAFAGTSFAAPVLSVFTALDYTGRAPRCPAAYGRGTPLAFYDTDQRGKPPLNVSLEDAITQNCARP